MLQPQLLLLLMVAVVSIVLLLEVGFENKLSGSSFVQSNRTLRGLETVTSTALKNDHSSQEALKLHPEGVLVCDICDTQIIPTHSASNVFASQKFMHADYRISAPTRQSSKATRKLRRPSLTDSRKTKWNRKRISLADLSDDITNRQMDLNKDSTFLSQSRSHLNKILHPIKGMPVIKNQSVLRVLIVTYFRAGSTFLGDILQQNWKTFYHFEPLHILSQALRVDDDQSYRVLDFLSHLFRCDFTTSSFYVKWASEAKHQFLFRRNHFLWATCGNVKNQSCFLPEYVSEVCKRAPVQVMKVTRLHMHHAEQFLKLNADLNVKVVHLVRDPRGIINSRKVLEWCNHQKACVNPKELCLEMQRDLEIFQKMHQEYREGFIQVRYEDFALNASQEAKTLYEALGMQFTSVVQQFIKSHTHARVDETNNPYSTRRNSSSVAFEWKHKLTFKEIEAIQRECSVVMDTLGYRKFSSQEDQKDVRIPIIKNIL